MTKIYREELGIGKEITGELLHGDVVAQSFTAKTNKLINFGINIATFRRKNNVGRLTFKILNKKDKCLFKTNVNINPLPDNKYINFDCNIDVKEDEKYFLIIYNNHSLKNQGITLRWKKCKSQEKFAIRKKEIEGELNCYFTYHGNVLPPVEEDEVKKGLIRIVIPTFNTSKYLTKTLESISKQTYNYFDVHVVDDGSTEKEYDKIKSIVNKYRKIFNITLKRYKTNKGAPRARNAGLKGCTSEYIFFCDSDIQLTEDALERLIGALQRNTEATWSYCNYKLGREKKVFQAFDKEILKYKNICSTMSLIKTKYCPKWDESLKRLQDWDLFLTMSENGHKGIYVNDELFTAKKRNDGITFNSVDWKSAVKALDDKHNLKEAFNDRYNYTSI